MPVVVLKKFYSAISNQTICLTWFESETYVLQNRAKSNLSNATQIECQTNLQTTE